jgi:hypothetical protein
MIAGTRSQITGHRSTSQYKVTAMHELKQPDCEPRVVTACCKMCMTEMWIYSCCSKLMKHDFTLVVMSICRMYEYAAKKI